MACDYYPPIAPSTGRLVSGFGVRPGRTSGAPTFHAGLDFGIGDERPDVVPVYAVAAGLVEVLPNENVTRGPFAGYGNAVGLRHQGPDTGWWSFYAHLSARKGTLEGFRERRLVVPAGALLGWVGKTTNGKFVGMHQHLHFEVRRAKPDGGAPLPGIYGPTELPPAVVAANLRRGFNVDPALWLAARGVTIGGRGSIQVRPPACTPSVTEADALARVALL